MSIFVKGERITKQQMIEPPIDINKEVFGQPRTINLIPNRENANGDLMEVVTWIGLSYHYIAREMNKIKYHSNIIWVAPVRKIKTSDSKFRSAKKISR